MCSRFVGVGEDVLDLLSSLFADGFPKPAQ
jgi:hypothetical protein